MSNRGLDPRTDDVSVGILVYRLGEMARGRLRDGNC